jgi:hypothetical protein
VTPARPAAPARLRRARSAPHAVPDASWPGPGARGLLAVRPCGRAYAVIAEGEQLSGGVGEHQGAHKH